MANEDTSLLGTMEAWVEATQELDRLRARIFLTTGMEPEQVMDGMRKLLGPKEERCTS